MGQVRQGILTNGFAKAPNPNARLLSLPGRFDQPSRMLKFKLFRFTVVVFLLYMFVCAGSSKSSAERYAVSYRSFDSHDSEEVESFLWETFFT